jgi:hypothetical protein
MLAMALLARRRIANGIHIGMRYVQEEEDQM